MSIITKPYTFTASTTIVSAQVNSNFDTLYTEVNGNLDNTNIKASAGIVFSKLDSATVVGLTDSQTLTNKRITKRVGTTASSSTPTPDADSHDVYTVTALATGATFGAPTGTPTNGQSLILRILDNGTARSLAFNAIYREVGVTLPTTTTISKTMYVGCIYNSADTKWDVLAVQEQA